MGWRDDLLPASFRGVEFHYLDVSGEGGRRLQLSEYPLRDDPYIEDLGLKAGSRRVSGYVLGKDYGPQRDALIAALNAKGPGTFVHPFQGPISLCCNDFRYRETNQDGGYCEFEIEYLPAGKAPSPTAATATAEKAQDKAKSAMGALGTAFAGLYQIAGYPARLAGEATKLVGELKDTLSPITNAVAALQTDATTLLGGLNALKLAVLEPLSLGNSVIFFFQNFADDVAGLIPAFDDTQSSRGPVAVTDPSYGIAALTGWGADLAAVEGTIPVRVQQQTNQDALVLLVQGAAACALVQIYAQTDFTSLTDAGDARDQVVDALDAVVLKAADAGLDDVYQALMTLQQAAVQDLTTRAKQLPDVVTMQLPGSLPSLVVAQRLYRDAGRAGELVSRNAAPHPLFMPATIEALTS